MASWIMLIEIFLVYWKCHFIETKQIRVQEHSELLRSLYQVQEENNIWNREIVKERLSFKWKA